MSYEVGSAYLTILPSARGFSRALSNELGGTFTSAGTLGAGQIGAGMTGARGTASFRGAGARLGGVFAAAFAALAAVDIIGKTVDYVQESITAASDLYETQNKVEQVFGSSAKVVEEFANDSTRNILLTKQAALDAASTFGIFAQSAGLTGDAAASFSTDLTALASDFSSFYNTDVDTAITAIGAALRGESEPIRQYGVLLDDATLRQRAFALGLIDSTKNALTPQQRVLAAQAEILAQTTVAQGDAARTADGYANRQRILNKTLEDTKAEIGTSLLPVMNDLLGVFSDVAMPILKDFAQWFTDNKETVRTFVIGVVDGLLAMAEGFVSYLRFLSQVQDFWITVFTNMGQTFLNIVELVVDGAANMFGWIPGIGPQLTQARADFETFRKGVDLTFSTMRDGADTTTRGLDSMAGSIGEIRKQVQALNGAKANIIITANGTKLLTSADGSFRIAGTSVQGRASGGPVVAGRPYWVGEEGPELVTFNQGGYVHDARTSASAVAGGSGPSNTFYITQQSDPVGAANAVVRRVEMAAI